MDILSQEFAKVKPAIKNSMSEFAHTVFWSANMQERRFLLGAIFIWWERRICNLIQDALGGLCLEQLDQKFFGGGQFGVFGVAYALAVVEGRVKGDVGKLFG